VEQWRVGHYSPIRELYASSVRNWSPSSTLASAISTLNSQPLSSGESLMKSGLSTTSSLTSVMVPETGANTSPTDLVDSTSATTFPSSTAAPTEGSSANTISPSLSAA